MRAVCLARPNQYAGVFLPPLDHFLIACGSMTAPQTADMQGFENIGLSLRVFADDQVDTGVKFDAGRLIIPEIVELQALQLHARSSVTRQAARDSGRRMLV